jgi:ATP-dependent protease ClpP protease subunit
MERRKDSVTMAQAQNVFYISYFDGIDDQKVRTLMGVCSDILNKHRPDTLYFLFASGGGGVNAGIVFHNFLRSLPAKVIMHNTGVIDSISTIIFLAGAERYACPHSSFLFHGIQWTFEERTSAPASKLAEVSSQLKQDESKMANIYTERTKLTDAEVRSLFLQGESKDPSFAMEKGIIHDIKSIAVPQGAPHIVVNVK